MQLINTLLKDTATILSTHVLTGIKHENFINWCMQIKDLNLNLKFNMK